MANVQYYDVILKPVVTEKSMNAMGEKKYTFMVHPEANKSQIKEAVEKMLSAKGGNGQSYPVSITPTDHPTRYLFEIAGVIREAEDYQLEITANGSPAGIDRKLAENVLIPAKNDFRFLSAKRIDEPENGIEIVFSDPVSTTQDLNGLIEIPEVSSSIFQVENN